jgi:tRNA (guanine37-N1)-methyltransferase
MAAGKGGGGLRFDILTLFPGMFPPVLGESVIGRAVRAGAVELNLVDIRAFSRDKHHKTDDYPYGGGTGLVMTPQPLYDAWASVAFPAPPGGIAAAPTSAAPCERLGRTIVLSPQGARLTQQAAISLSREPRLILVCGHYEGMDERVLELLGGEELSIGDYVLTGGEIPAMALVDCVSRLVPGVLPSEEAWREESHVDGLLEFPQYTRPERFMGLGVPEVLLSGHHRKIQEWRRARSVERTRRKRPDMPGAGG